MGWPESGSKKGEVACASAWCLCCALCAVPLRGACARCLCCALCLCVCCASAWCLCEVFARVLSTEAYGPYPGIPYDTVCRDQSTRSKTRS